MQCCWLLPCSGFVISVQVDRCLSTLQTEVENFILRMAAEFPERKEQLIFLINNYDMMLAVLNVWDKTTQILHILSTLTLTTHIQHIVPASLLTSNISSLTAYI